METNVTTPTQDEIAATAEFIRKVSPNRATSLLTLGLAFAIVAGPEPEPAPAAVAKRASAKASKPAPAAKPAVKAAKRTVELDPEETGPESKRQRASGEEVQGLKDKVLAAAKNLPGGWSKADITAKLGTKENLTRILGLLADEGKLTKHGDRRNTRYWLPEAKAKAEEAS